MNYKNNKLIDDKIMQQYNNEYFPKNNLNQNPLLNQNTVYHGRLFIKNGLSWTLIPTAVLTRQGLIDHSVQSMTKVKAKLEIVHQNTYFLKITTSIVQDHIFGCEKNEQLGWLCSIIWVKMVSMNRYTDRYVEFNGNIQG